MPGKLMPQKAERWSQPKLDLSNSIEVWIRGIPVTLAQQKSPQGCLLFRPLLLLNSKFALLPRGVPFFITISHFCSSFLVGAVRG